MYSVTNTTEATDLMSYMEGNDIYNSKLLYDIDTKATPDGTYSSVYNKGRLDLVALELYSESEVTNLGVLQVLNRMTYDYDTDMVNIKYLDQSQIDNLKMSK